MARGARTFVVLRQDRVKEKYLAEVNDIVVEFFFRIPCIIRSVQEIFGKDIVSVIIDRMLPVKWRGFVIRLYPKTGLGFENARELWINVGS